MMVNYMNDFTKEDLETLLALLSEKEALETKQALLWLKLHKLIDNYCAHEWNELQLNTINIIKSILNDCNYIDIVIRHNGEDRVFQADFLKQLIGKIDS